MKLTTIITAAALALTISAGTIHTTDAREHGPRLVLNGPDAGIQLPDGRAVQFEYMTEFVLDSAGIIDCKYWEDGSLSCD